MSDARAEASPGRVLRSLPQELLRQTRHGWISRQGHGPEHQRQNLKPLDPRNLVPLERLLEWLQELRFVPRRALLARVEWTFITEISRPCLLLVRFIGHVASHHNFPQWRCVGFVLLEGGVRCICRSAFACDLSSLFSARCRYRRSPTVPSSPFSRTRDGLVPLDGRLPIVTFGLQRSLFSMYQCLDDSLVLSKNVPGTCCVIVCSLVSIASKVFAKFYSTEPFVITSASPSTQLKRKCTLRHTPTVQWVCRDRQCTV